MPKRIKLSREKGWRMPAGAVKVDRTTRWGNPYRPVGKLRPALLACIAHYAAWIRESGQRPLRGDAIAFLSGIDLACWCRLCPAHWDGLPLGVKCDQCAPCHADVLLAVANAGALS